jgi:tRNA pseudouridine38-40 synthase
LANETTGAAVLPRRDRRVALLLEYDGARFAGSQLQANAVTVQGALEDAILKATEGASRAAFAGRTDSGVHARGQVVAFTTNTWLDNETLQRALNAWLPEDVAVRAVADVVQQFDPRRDARRRWYRYVIDNRDVRPALGRGRAWHVPGALDVRAMDAAAKGLVGSHDFAAFASKLEDAAASTVREVYAFDVTREGHFVHVDVTANAFLPHQVRRMTGALVEVGRGKLTGEAFSALLDGPAASAGPAAPARGLYLMRVEYAERVFALDSEAAVC